MHSSVFRCVIKDTATKRLEINRWWCPQFTPVLIDWNRDAMIRQQTDKLQISLSVSSKNVPFLFWLWFCPRNTQWHFYAKINSYECLPNVLHLPNIMLFRSWISRSPISPSQVYIVPCSTLLLSFCQSYVVGINNALNFGIYKRREGNLSLSHRSLTLLN